MSDVRPDFWRTVPKSCAHCATFAQTMHRLYEALFRLELDRPEAQATCRAIRAVLPQDWPMPTRSEWLPPPAVVDRVHAYAAALHQADAHPTGETDRAYCAAGRDLDAVLRETGWGKAWP